MVNDIRGKEIKVGSTICYPGRQSSSLWMNIGEVVEIDENWKKWCYGKDLTLRRLKVKVPSHSYYQPVEGKFRNVWITELNRVVVVE